MFIGALILSGLAALLALLLEIAGRLIVNYGDCRILINGERELTVKGGNSLLFSLMDEGIFIPSACGGRGTCAYCKVKVREGGGPVLPTETPYLDAQEIGANVRLSCQVKVRNDLAIELPEELFLIKEYRMQVAELSDLTPTIKGVVLSIVSPEEGIVFRPGQYVQLEIPPYKLSNHSEYRAFSLASPASRHDRIELFIARVEGGVVSTYIHDYLQKGEELTVRGPYGDFYYRPSERDVLLIGTGSGLAPLMSILHHLAAERTPHKIILFFGTRRPENLYRQEQIAELGKNIPHFRYIPVLSRVLPETRWQGEKGRVTDLIAKYVDGNAHLDSYICGNADMVESCRTALIDKGIPEDRIFYDKFT